MLKVEATSRARFEGEHPGVFHLDAEAPAELEVYLAGRGLLAPGESVLAVSRAGEGNMNCAVRVTTGGRSLILKQSRPWVEKYPQFAAPWDRALREIQFYELVADTPAVAARMPRLLHADVVARLLVLEDVGAGADLTGIYRGAALCPEVVDALADYLTALHGGFREESRRQPLPNREMRALNHAHIFEIPLQRENGLALDQIQPGLQAIGDLLKSDGDYVAMVRQLGATVYLADGECLVHGDFFPGSILASPSGPRVIDPEFGYFGRSEFDGGVFLAHLRLGSQAPAVAARFLDRYRPPPGHDLGIMLRLAGVEIMRRLIGYAQLPLRGGLSERHAWLLRSRELVLRPALALI